ncbi:hypothetical protein [Bdellovibrio sp. HCB209]|uniref:hypothetical protein n=1 Tax=Bdellovibrio sp. HCB209 TaxID=3394354 RepID=UPI0039B4AB67
MVSAQARQYIANKLEEQAKQNWLFSNLKFEGEIPNQGKNRIYGFSDVCITLNHKGDLWIEGPTYRNFISSNNYHTAKEAVDLLHDQLRYIDENYKRLQSSPEIWVKKGLFTRIKERIAS